MQQAMQQANLPDASIGYSSLQRATHLCTRRMTGVQLCYKNESGVDVWVLQRESQLTLCLPNPTRHKPQALWLDVSMLILCSNKPYLCDDINKVKHEMSTNREQIKQLAGALAWLMLLACLMLTLLGCSGLALERSGGSFAARAPLPGVAPLQSAPSVPTKRPVSAIGAAKVSGENQIEVWLYVSLASQEHLMTLGVDPSTGTRVWENYLRAHQQPYTRVTQAADLARVAKPGVLILASTVVLSDIEKQAVEAWRNRGGSILSTWMRGTHAHAGETVNYDFISDVLDLEVVGNTQNITSELVDRLAARFRQIHNHSDCGCSPRLLP
jgi:hypothetical protein